MRVLLTALAVLASVAVQTQTVNYKRGDVVRLQPSFSRAVYLVVAVAGEANFSPPNVSQAVIGEGYYFIVGDGGVNASSNWGVVPVERIFENVKPQ